MKGQPFVKRTHAISIGAVLGAAWLVGGTAGADDRALLKPSQADLTVAGATVVTANEILNRWEPVAVAAGMHPPAWREQLYTQLSLMPAAWLRMFDALRPSAALDAKMDYARFSQMFVNAQANVLSAAGKTSTKLASATSDLVFVPITPCRIVDTRNTGSPVVAGTPVKFFFFGDTGVFTFSTQGGVAGTAVAACAGTVLTAGGGTLGSVAPAAAAATVTVVGATAAGNFVVWGGSAPIPNSSVLNWTAGQTLANTTVIPSGGRTGGNKDFAVLYNGPSGQAHLIVDVVGYYIENTATALQCSTQVASGAGSITTGTAVTVAFPACTAGYTRTGGGCSTSVPVGANVYLQTDSSNSANCVYFNNSGSTVTGNTFRAEAVCCRLPGQ
jgi:hypothetical protein